MTPAKIEAHKRYTNGAIPLEGATLRRVLVGEYEAERAVFLDTDRGCFVFFHWQDCCESVELSEMTGGALPPGGAIVRLAEVRTESGDDSSSYDDWRADQESWTATFYAVRTDGPDIDMHWQGSSNGYYSEEVTVELLDSVPDGAVDCAWDEVTP